MKSGVFCCKIARIAGFDFLRSDTASQEAYKKIVSTLLAKF